MKSKNFSINLICQLIVFSTNMVINFFLTPYILKKLGTEAYGFIGLINNFVSYLGVVTIALNSMAGRYITLSYHKGEKETAEEYYSSVFFANVILSVVVFAAAIVLTVNVSKWLNVPTVLLKDVRVTIILAAVNTIISLITVVYGIAAFIKNKLYKNSMGQMIAAIARVCMMIVTFALFEAHMWYYTLAAIVSAVILLLIQMRITSKLCPEFTIDIKKLEVKKISEIIKSGAWVSVESFNKILQTGLDLLISNVFVGVGATGLLSIAKTIPNVLTQVTSTIAGVFNPELARLYAENRMDELKREFLFTVRALSFIMIVPLIGFIIFGREFYTLWLPQYSNEEVSLIQKLSVLTVLPLLVNAYVEGLYYANTLTNKIKGSVLISLGFSVGSIATELFFLNYTTIEPLFLIAGTSSVFLMIRYMVVTPLYSAYVLKLPLLTFYPVLIRTIAVSGFIGIMFYIVKYIVPIKSWFQLILCCGSCGIIGYLFVFFTLLSRQERKKMLHLIKRKGKNAKNCL